MPTRSSVHRPKPTTATIDLGDGETLTLVFDRDRITPDWLRASQEATEDAYVFATALAEVIDSWDLYEEDGVTLVPTSADEIATLSFDALAAILKAIGEAAAPSRAEGNASSKPSSIPPSDSTAPPSTPQNGPVTSPSPELSASPSPT